jgi:hypothetical protein
VSGTETDYGLEAFLAAAKKGDGTYAVIAARRRDIEWAVQQIVKAGDVTIRRGSMEARWPAGAVAYLVTDLERLRGTRLDGAWLVHGDPRFPLLPATRMFLQTVRKIEWFDVWESYW